MSYVRDSVVSTTARPVSLRMRPDLRFERHVYQGEVSWVAKDPINLRYYRLPEEEYAVLQMLNGEATLDEIKINIERKFAPIIVSYEEVQSLLGMLHQYGLVLSDADGQGEQLYKRKKTVQRRQMMGRLASVLWIRLPGVDPERFLTWGYPYVRWFFTKWCMAVCLLAGLAALLLVGTHADEFYRRLPSFHQFFSAQNMVWTMAALAGAKILHELGHGMACKHFGGECHEIGIMLLVFTPCLYCDTSDSWMLKSKWHRAAIGAAGMYVEVVLATICTFIWWNTQPGLLHYLCLSTMFVCSISTVIFNSNPLLRYDGYYIASDLLEVPNLAQKSRGAMLGLLRQTCLGIPWNDHFNVPPRSRVLFATYSVASVVYRWMVLIGILWFLSKVFEPYGLQPIGHMMLAMSLVSMVVMPLWKSFKYFQVPGRMRQVKKVRLLATLAVVGAVVSFIAFVPLPLFTVMAACVVQPHDAEAIYVHEPGKLKSIEVEPGQFVDGTDKPVVLAELANPDIDLEIIRLEGECARYESRIDSLKLAARTQQISNYELRRVEQDLKNTQEQLEQQRTRRTELKLVSDRKGYIIPPTEKPPQPANQGQLGSWSGTLLEKKNTNTWLEVETLFCHVGDPGDMEALVVIDQGDMEFVAKGQRVEIMLDEYPGKKIWGEIVEISDQEMRFSPRELSNKYGGGLITESDPSGNERPMSASYYARVPIENFDGKLLSGFRGAAKVHTRPRTLGAVLVRFVFQAFRFG